jgi:hypothetical protein
MRNNRKTSLRYTLDFDPASGADPDPTFYFDADPNPDPTF